MELSEKIQRLRTNQGLSQIKAAELAGISLRSWTNYETGASLPRSMNIYSKLAKALNCSVAYLSVNDASIDVDLDEDEKAIILGSFIAMLKTLEPKEATEMMSTVTSEYFEWLSSQLPLPSGCR